MFINWFKSNLISLGIICALIIYIVFNNTHNKYALESKKINDTLKPVFHYIDSKGDSHAQIPVQIVTSNKEFKEATKGLKKQIKGNNAIQSVTTFTESIDTSFKNLKVDSTNTVITFKKEDNYIKAEASYNKLTHLGDISIKTIDTLTYVVEVEKHFFRKNELKIDIKNKSPYNSIKEGSSITLKEQRTILDFALIAGYNPFTKQIVYGIGVAVPIFSIKTRK